MLMLYQLWYKKAIKTLQMYIGTTCYPPPVITSMHLVLACLLKFIMNYQEDVEPEMF
jgi:hypothetical protein